MGYGLGLLLGLVKNFKTPVSQEPDMCQKIGDMWLIALELLIHPVSSNLKSKEWIKSYVEKAKLVFVYLGFLGLGG